MGSMSLIHWIIVLVVILLLFGPRRLPELAKSLGESIREFKKSINDSQQKSQIESGDNKSTKILTEESSDSVDKDGTTKK